MNTQDLPQPAILKNTPDEMKRDGWVFLCATMLVDQWDELNHDLPDGAEVVASQTFGQEGVNFWYRVAAGVEA